MLNKKSMLSNKYLLQDTQLSQLMLGLSEDNKYNVFQEILDPFKSPEFY